VADVFSLLDQPLYTYADVDRMVALSSGTGKRWLEGHYRNGQFYQPILRPEPTGAEFVTWGEMVEARLLAEYRDRSVPLRRLRPAVARLREEFGKYPLAQAHPFLTVEGKELVREIQTEVDLVRSLQLVVVRNNQLMLATETERFTNAVEYADNVVQLFRPSSLRNVVMDPVRSYGQPTVRNVLTEVIASDYRAGATREELCDLYELTPEQVDDAIRFEMARPLALAS